MKRLLPIFLILVFSACDKSEETVTHEDSEGNASAISAEESGETRVVKSKDGKVLATGTKGGSAAVFPEYAPQYPGSKIVSSVNIQMAPSSPPSVNTNMTTADSVEQVVEFYKSKATAAGLGIIEQKYAKGIMLSVGPKGKLGMSELVITIDAAGPDDTRISTMLTK